MAPTDDSIDLRHLPAPQPLERALAAADALSPGQSIEVLTPMLPLPLLQLLADRGYRVQARTEGDGSGRVRVQRPAD